MDVVDEETPWEEWSPMLIPASYGVEESPVTHDVSKDTVDVRRSYGSVGGGASASGNVALGGGKDAAAAVSDAAGEGSRKDDANAQDGWDGRHGYSHGDASRRRVERKLSTTPSHAASYSNSTTYKASANGVQRKRSDVLKQSLRDAMKELQNSVAEAAGSHKRGGVGEEVAQPDEGESELVQLMTIEKEQQEIRSAKTIALLQSKDAMIDELSYQYESMVGQMDELKKGLDSAEARSDQAEQKRRSAEAEAKELTSRILDMERAHEKQVGALKEKIVEMQLELEAQGEGREEIEEIASALDAAEEIIKDMESKYAKDMDAMEAKCSRLAEFIAGKLKMEVDDVYGLPSVRGVEGIDVEKNADLLAANKALEEALIKSGQEIRHVTVNSLGHGGSFNVAVPATYEDEKGLGLVEDESIDSLRSEVEHLRQAHDIAHQVALRAEGQLLEALDRESELKEQLAAALAQSPGGATPDNVPDFGTASDTSNKPSHVPTRIDEAPNAEEAKWREDAMNKILDLEDECESLQKKLEKSSEEADALKETAHTAQHEKSEALKKAEENTTTIVQMHGEIQELRSELYSVERQLCSKEAEIASMEAAHKLSSQMMHGYKEKEDTTQERIDPISKPIELLALSLKEAAEMQTELLASLGELSYINNHSQEIIECMQRDMDRLRRAVIGNNASFIEETKSNMVTQFREAKKSELDLLRADAEKSLAIQQGQASAFASLAAKSRTREAEMKETVEEALLALNENKELICGLKTAVGAIKSSLAQVVLVEEDEDAANQLLSAPANPSDILDLSITVSEKLKVLACDSLIV